MKAERDQVLTRIAIALGLQSVTAADNFFDLGGDSLAAIEIVQILENAGGGQVGLEQVLGAANIGEMIALLEPAP